MNITIGIIWTAVLMTSTLSGVLGMGGGVILMFTLLSVLDIQAAMILHGIVQLVANGSRAVTHRQHIWWHCIGWYALGSVVAVSCLATIKWLPGHRTVYLAGGLIPLLQFLPIKRLQLDITNRFQATVCGGMITVGQIAAGAAGPLLDAFFSQVDKGRHGIVATKSATQVLAHFIKTTYFAAIASGYWTSLDRFTSQSAEHDRMSFSIFEGTIGSILLLGSIVLAIVGTLFGSRILAKISDQKFSFASRCLLLVLSFYSFSKLI